MSEALSLAPVYPQLSVRQRFPRALVWLLILAPLFFATYSLANWFTSQRADVGTLVFAWEQHTPFWAWTIVPYWSIDLLYGLSLLLCSSRHELDIHARRLLSAQVLAIAGFLLFPLTYTFSRPEMTGFFAWMFEVLMGFDKPFNQAPSLHIVLLMVLWVRYAAHTPKGLLRWLLHLWFGLIGLSVLTTYQHHFIDLPTGVLVGWLCIWLWPLDRPSPLANLRWQPQAKGRRLAFYYALGGVALGALGVSVGGLGWWLTWPATALCLVALNYLLVGAPGFQKHSDGTLSWASNFLFGPYLIGAWVNSRLWTARQPAPVLIMDDVWLGRIPNKGELDDTPIRAIVDLCAELPCASGGRAYRSLPTLDLLPPSPELLCAAAMAIEQARQQGPVLVCCALGYSRSAAAVAAWLLHSGRAANPQAAEAILRQVRPGVVLREGHLRNLAAMEAGI